MGKIEGSLGIEDPIIAIVVVGMRFKRHDKKQIKILDYAAIQRFRNDGNRFRYVLTPIQPSQALKPDTVKDYLKQHWRTKGKEITGTSQADLWDTGTLHNTKNKKQAPGARTPKQLHEYTSEIAGNIAFKTEKKLKSIIRMAEGSNREFMKDLWT